MAVDQKLATTKNSNPARLFGKCAQINCGWHYNLQTNNFSSAGSLHGSPQTPTVHFLSPIIGGNCPFRRRTSNLSPNNWKDFMECTVGVAFRVENIILTTSGGKQVESNRKWRKITERQPFIQIELSSQDRDNSNNVALLKYQNLLNWLEVANS
jgi:hypothetical protein